MATITGLTAERMLEIEAASVVSGAVVGDNLILKRFDDTTVDAGNLRGPQGIQGPAGEVTAAALAAALVSAIPVGTIADYIGITAPTNWLTMYGQTILDGQTLHPALWAILPAGMKSGANIIMPDTRGRVSIGYNTADTDFDTLGEVGGSKTHVLTQGQLPAAPITIDPPATNLTVDPPNTGITIAQPGFNATADPPYTLVSVNPPSTTIAINPPPTTVTISPPRIDIVTGANSVAHSHTYFHAGGNVIIKEYPFSDGTTAAVAGPMGYTASSGSNSANHTHQSAVIIPAFNETVDIPSFNAAVDIAPFNIAVNMVAFAIPIAPPAFTAYVDIAPFLATVDVPAFWSSNLGLGEAHPIVQPYVVFLKMIKAA
jgi:microcystin-dependent protein